MTALMQAEVMMTLDWIAEHRAAGMPCENCGHTPVADEPYAVTTVQTSLGKVFSIACGYCGYGKCPNVRAKCNVFLATHCAGNADPNWPRLASDEAAEIIAQLMESERASSEALRWVRWVQ